MLYIIIFTVIGGAIAFGLFTLLYRRKIYKKGSIDSKSLLHKAPSIFGIINFILSAFFLTWFTSDPVAFSSEQTITSPFLYILVTILSTYLYVLALPLSVGSIGISIVFSRKRFYSKIRFLFCTIINSISAIMLFVLTYMVFSR